MSKKTYKSLTGIGYTFPVKVNDKVCWISVSGEQFEYSTSNKQVQEAIENTGYFLDKKIGIASSEAKREDENLSGISPVEYPEVTDLNDAVSVLKREPYRVHHSKLKDKDSVLKIAEELGASFPNLKFD